MENRFLPRGSLARAGRCAAAGAGAGAAALALLVLLAPPCSGETWAIETIVTTGNVGLGSDVQTDPVTGELQIVYLRQDTHTLQFVTGTAGAWGAPTTIDGSAAVDGPCAISIDGSGDLRIGYHRSDNGGTAWFAGPEVGRSWTAEAVAQSGDVGRNPAVVLRPDDEIGVAYRNQTSGALHHSRCVDGVWGAPIVVDPGPGRGLACDLAYRAGAGYAFSEYAESSGSAIFADLVFAPRPFQIEAATAQPDNVGVSLSLLLEQDGTLTAAFRNQTQGALQCIRHEAGGWSAPVTIDPGPDRGNNPDVVRRTPEHLSFSEYAGGTGSAIFADPSLEARPFVIEAATTQTEDVGRGLSLLDLGGGSLLAAFRNQDQGSLQSIRRESGSWTEPVTVDPGPERGSYCDVTMRPGSGDTYSEYDSRNGMVLLADRDLRGRSWWKDHVDPRYESGSQASLFLREPDRLDCAYLSKNPNGTMQLRVTEIVPDSAFIIRVVADSVSLAASGHVMPDVHVTPDRQWLVSYRNAIGADLWLASTGPLELLPADAPEQAGGEAGGSEAEARTFLSGTYPNPASSIVRIRFSAAATGEVALEVFDAQGRQVRRSLLPCSRGTNVVRFDGRSETGRPLAPGMYFLRMRVDGKLLGPRKILLIGDRAGPE